MPTYTEEEWAGLAARRGFADEAAMWNKLYVEDRKGLLQLAAELDLGWQTIRRRLAKLSIPIHAEGGSEAALPPLTDEELAAIRREGIAVAARRRNVTYHQLYRRVRQDEARRAKQAKS